LTSTSLADPAANVIRALSTLEQEFGGRDALIEALAYRDLSPEEQSLALMLGNPDYARVSLAKLAGDAGLSLPQVIRLLGSARGAKAVLQSWDKLYSQAPAVVEDFTARALPHRITCQDCIGTGQAADGTPCLRCRGRATIPAEPSLKRQERVLQAVGILKQPGAPPPNQVNVQVNIPRNSAEFRQETDRLLYGKKAEAVVEAEEVVEIVPSGTAGGES
jgi:hypothetical protein